ncbi:MAG: MazG nucleotide pyrophosphohydrolase domain-containing protein, partial [Pseudomonadota bacterium]
KLQKRAARVGFDWTDAKDVLAKIVEETNELAEAAEHLSDDAIEDEFGDLLFVIANLSRHLKVDPEAALRRANQKFIRRFAHIENALAENGRTLEGASLAEMEDLWTEAKMREWRA